MSVKLSKIKYQFTRYANVKYGKLNGKKIPPVYDKSDVSYYYYFNNKLFSSNKYIFTDLSTKINIYNNYVGAMSVTGSHFSMSISHNKIIKTYYKHTQILHDINNKDDNLLFIFLSDKKFGIPNRGKFILNKILFKYTDKKEYTVYKFGVIQNKLYNWTYKENYN